MAENTEKKTASKLDIDRLQDFKFHIIDHAFKLFQEENVKLVAEILNLAVVVTN